MKTLWIVLVILLKTVASVSAFEVEGLQPLAPYGEFSTFSADSLEHNHVGIGEQFEKVVKPNFYRATTEIAYGLHDRFEIDMTFPYVFNYEKKIDGPEDVNFGIRHRVLDEGTYNPAIAYMLTFAAPTGRDQFSTNGEHGAGLLFTKKIGPFKGDVNILAEKPGESYLHSQYKFNIGTELAITHDSNILAELITRKDYFKTKIDLVEWRVGYRIATLDNLYTTIGGGFNLENRSPDFRFLFSVSVILPKEKKKLERIYE